MKSLPFALLAVVSLAASAVAAQPYFGDRFRGEMTSNIEIKGESPAAGSSQTDGEGEVKSTGVGAFDAFIRVRSKGGRDKSDIKITLNNDGTARIVIDGRVYTGDSKADDNPKSPSKKGSDDSSPDSNDDGDKSDDDNSNDDSSNRGSKVRIKTIASGSWTLVSGNQIAMMFSGKVRGRVTEAIKNGTANVSANMDLDEVTQTMTLDVDVIFKRATDLGKDATFSFTGTR